ncbi:MAG: hypothetical protein DYG89_13805 [Caldilinea sp. CFX5]|nr:hypothetical protein [Caldilinea sp. CFX5]
MIRTTVVGSWPPAAEFIPALEAYHQGRLSPEETEPLLQRVAAQAIAEQCACGLQEYTGGETAADTFILHFPAGLTGIEPTEDREAWGNRGTYCVVGPLAAPNGLGIAAALQRERALDAKITKVTLPGPSEITMRIEPVEARRATWPAVIDLIRTEIQACIDLGATDIQLDLPHVAMGLVDNKDGWTTASAAALIHALFAGFTGIRRSVHFCYGDFMAQSWTTNRTFHPLLPTIQALAGVIDRVVLEFSLPEQWAERALLAQIPQSMEVAVGIIDVKSPIVETPAAVVAKIQELLSYVPAARLLICPSCGLGRRDTALAVGKAQVMMQAVQTVNQTIQVR